MLKDGSKEDKRVKFERSVSGTLNMRLIEVALVPLVESWNG
jgi:hypothetical protein